MNSKKRKGFLDLFRGSSVSDSYNEPEHFYYEQIAAAVGAGGWTIDFVKKKSFFDKQLRDILNTPQNFKPSLNNALNFYDHSYHERVMEVYEQLKEGISCEHEVQMLTYDKKLFWAKCIGKPILNKNKKVIGIRGIILNINTIKARECSLHRSLEAIERSTAKLFKFANHISHNLKNQINNLELTSQLIDSSNMTPDQAELFNNYDEIAQSLSKTVKQLNEVVSIQNKAKEQLENIDLQAVFEACKSDLQEMIQQEEGTVYSDFSEAPEIQFNLTFFKNIFCTLIKNGLKNAKPGRKPEVKAYSLEENGAISVVIEDNGSGIEVSDDDEFLYYISGSGTYKSSKQAVNLFVIINQVEAMGGTLEIESKAGYGTKFIIHI